MHFGLNAFGKKPSLINNGNEKGATKEIL